MNGSTLLLGLALSAFLATPGTAQIQALVAHWTFDETSGTVLHDSSGNALDATIQGGVSLGHPGASVSSGNAAFFDSGAAGCGVVPDQAPLATLLDDLSVAAWVRVEVSHTGTGHHHLFGGDGSAWSCGVRAPGLRFSTRAIQNYDVGLSYPPSQWMHVAFVFDAAHDAAFYLDGAPVGFVMGSAPANASSGQWLIGALSTGAEFWHGYLDDLQVYEGTLTAADVAHLHQNPGSTVAPGIGTTTCFGDGTGLPCPCGNAGLSGEGCASSLGTGARLTALGSVSVIGDDLRFVGEGLVPGQLALLFAGRNPIAGGLGRPFGDGLRCTGGGVVRLGTVVVDGGGGASWGPGLGAAGGWTSGDIRHFQVWYQDSPASPCGSLFNTTPAIELAFAQ